MQLCLDRLAEPASDGSEVAAEQERLGIEQVDRGRRGDTEGVPHLAQRLERPGMSSLGGLGQHRAGPLGPLARPSHARVTPGQPQQGFLTGQPLEAPAHALALLVRRLDEREPVAADLTDEGTRRALFARLGAGAARALVVSEGLLVYLTEAQVGALAGDLHAQPSFAWWLIDLASPRMVKMMEKTWGKSVAEGNAPFRFGPASGTAFFAPHGWREAQFRSTMDEARRLRREMRGMWIWRPLMRLYPARAREEFRRMSGTVLLERG